MKKITKLLLIIPLITTPLFCCSCQKKDNEKEQKKEYQYSTKELNQLIKDLIFIENNKYYPPDENNECEVRKYIWAILIEVEEALQGSGQAINDQIFKFIEQINEIILKMENKLTLEAQDYQFIDKTRGKCNVIINKILKEQWKERTGEMWRPNRYEEDD